MSSASACLFVKCAPIENSYPFATSGKEGGRGGGGRGEGGREGGREGKRGEGGIVRLCDEA